MPPVSLPTLKTSSVILLARGAAAAHKRDGGVAELDLAGDIERLDLRVEVLARLEGGVLLVDHHVTDAGHVDLVETLDVHADVVTRLGDLVDALVVHLDGEHLAGAGVGDGVRGDEHDILTGADEPCSMRPARTSPTPLILYTPETGMRMSARARCGLVDHVVEASRSVSMWNLVSCRRGCPCPPPQHVLGLLDQVVAYPTGNGEDGTRLLDKVLLPADLDEHLPSVSPTISS